MGSVEADAYSREEVSFLSLVANQVALAVDDAFNVDASDHAQAALGASEELRLLRRPRENSNPAISNAWIIVARRSTN